MAVEETNTSEHKKKDLHIFYAFRLKLIKKKFVLNV